MAVVDQLEAHPPPPTQLHGQFRPSVAVKLAYSLGQMVESGYLTVQAFVFFYYTAVLGLSGSLVGVALAISMTIDAAIDPLIGSISDNVRSRFGRRLPMMAIGGPLFLLMLGLLFAPPVGLSPILLFAWLLFTKMGLRAATSLYNLPYAALGAEMTDGYAERASIVAYRAVAGIIIGVVITALAYSVFFAGKGGLQVREHYPAFGWSVALAMFIGATACCIGIWRYASRLPQPTTKAAPMLAGLLREVPEVFGNPSFRTLFGSALLFWVAAGLNGAFNNHAYVFIWKVPAADIQFITYAYLAGILAGVPITRALLRVAEKRTVILLGLGGVMVSMTVLQLLRAAGLFTLTGIDVVPWLCGNVVIAGVGVGLLTVAYPAMMADAADEHEHIYGARREGLYFAGLGFASKAAGGLGSMAAGFALDALHFPKSAGLQIGAQVDESILRLLVLAWGPLAAFLIGIGVLLLLPYNITRQRHAVLASDLRVRRAEEAGAGG